MVEDARNFPMRTFLYRCPRTNFKVQGHVDFDPPRRDDYVAQQCPLCGQAHLVNPFTGKLVSEEQPPPKRD